MKQSTHLNGAGPRAGTAAALDATVGATPDMTPDATPDATVDAALDAISDATVDATPDATPDATVDAATFSAGSSAAAPGDLGTADAGQVHELIKALHGLGNAVRLRFIDALRALHDGEMCLELGYTSYAQYCSRELGLARSSAHEYVRVAQALDGLPRLRVLFAHGDLSWEQVRAISRVATAATEMEWIELAFDETVRTLLAEVRNAYRTGRDAPRDRRHGLPNLLVHLTLELTLEDKERVMAAFELVSSGPGPELGGGPFETEARPSSGGRRCTDFRPPLVRWADAVLSGAIPLWRDDADESAVSGASAGSSAKRTKPAKPAQTILYRSCPECRESTVETADGPVSVAPERVVQLAPHANRVDIGADEGVESVLMPAGEVDDPNGAGLARRVLHRDGLRCANPGCGRRKNLHAHHIVFRSEGGRTVLANEVAVCETCHAMLHQGLLEVSGTPDDGLTWTPRPKSMPVQVRDSAFLRDRLRKVDRAIAGLGEGARTGSGDTPGGAAGERANGTHGRAESTCLDTAGRTNCAAQPKSTCLDPAGRTNDAAQPESTCLDSGPARQNGANAVSGWRPLRSESRQSMRQDTAKRIRDLAEGMVRLGCSRREGEQRVRSAIETLQAERRARTGTHDPYELPGDEDIILQALRE